MGLVEIFFLGVGLAMDAFAVSICKGLSMKKINWKSAIIIAIYFGLFQAGMPVIGYFLGSTFSSLIQQIDHWVAFILLSIIGGNMIKESRDDEVDKRNDRVDFKTMIVLAIATSIDALAVGVTFAFFEVNLMLAITIIGVVTLILSFIGVVIGNKFGDKFQNKAELAGGIILIALGIKILLEHLNIINFS
ncbi:MAG: manganese efflux pump [Clostridia bacterium]|nr:manganese efflux pump [Clostridia bacterium]